MAIKALIQATNQPINNIATCVAMSQSIAICPQQYTALLVPLQHDYNVRQSENSEIVTEAVNSFG